MNSHTFNSGACTSTPESQRSLPRYEMAAGHAGCHTPHYTASVHTHAQHGPVLPPQQADRCAWLLTWVLLCVNGLGHCQGSACRHCLPAGPGPALHIVLLCSASMTVIRTSSGAVGRLSPCALMKPLLHVLQFAALTSADDKLSC